MCQVCISLEIKAIQFVEFQEFLSQIHVNGLKEINLGISEFVVISVQLKGSTTKVGIDNTK